MAFSFVVEDGSADSEATSYCTVEFADDYIEANIYASTEWLALEEEDKERLLVRASRHLDRNFVWEGLRVDQDSGLRWPRSGVYDADNFLICPDVIPEVLKEATAEMASYLMQNDWTNAEEGRSGLKEVKVDVIEVKFDTGLSSRGVIPSAVSALLLGLGTAETGHKPRFKKIVRH